MTIIIIINNNNNNNNNNKIIAKNFDHKINTQNYLNKNKNVQIFKPENMKKAIFYWNAKFTRCKYSRKNKNCCRCISNKETNKKQKKQTRRAI